MQPTCHRGSFPQKLNGSAPHGHPSLVRTLIVLVPLFLFGCGASLRGPIHAADPNAGPRAAAQSEVTTAASSKAADAPLKTAS